MAIWAIADIHSSRLDPETGLPTKPMDVFGPHWAGHLDRIERAWKEVVDPNDTVIIAGDLEWALRPEEALDTLRRMEGWSGRKLLIRGNHDYWWSSKATSKVRRMLPSTFTLIHNDSHCAEGFNICGAKGSPVPGAIEWTDRDEKLLHREVQRLQLSLGARDERLPTIVALHYPPFYPVQDDSPYRDLIESSGAVACIYGHLHGTGRPSGPVGRYGGATYYLVAADYVRFRPVLIAVGGEIIPPPETEGGHMEPNLPTDDLEELAEKLMSDKEDELGNETQARELYDVPTETDGELAEQQESEAR